MTTTIEAIPDWFFIRDVSGFLVFIRLDYYHKLFYTLVYSSFKFGDRAEVTAGYATPATGRSYVFRRRVVTKTTYYRTAALCKLLKIMIAMTNLHHNFEIAGIYRINPEF
jgi:hypothetical protein